MRLRPAIWIFVCALILAGAWLFLRVGERPTAAEKSGGPTAAASTAPKSPTPGTVAKNVSKSGAAAMVKTNQFAWRLSNTTQPIGVLMNDPRAILLENALIDTRLPLNLAFPKNLQAQDNPGAYIVQARGPVDSAFRAMLAGSGAQIISYIPNNAYLVTMPAGAASQITASGFSVLPYEPYYKVQPALLAFDQKSLPAGAELNLGLFAGDAAATVQQIEKLGGTVLATDGSPFGPVVRVQPPANWTALAQLPGVQIVEPFHRRIQANDLSRQVTGVAVNSTAPTNYMNLYGSNVMVEVNDSGIDATHPDLTGRVFGFPTNDTDGHGTFVAGEIAGDGTKSTTVTNAEGSINPGTNGQYRGKAPLAKLFSMVQGGNSDQTLQQAAALTNALISNNSWNYGDSTYDLAAASYDAATRDALPAVTGSQPVLFVFAAGNNGNGDDTSDSSGGNADTIESPATAKDVITVGAIQEDRNITNQVTNADNTVSQPWKAETSTPYRVAGFSSRGNVGIGIEGSYGRFKPDVVSPGTFVVSTRSQEWDTNAYFSNPTNGNISTITDVLQPYSITEVPLQFFVYNNASQVTIQATTLDGTTNVLPIYVWLGTDPNTAPPTYESNNYVALPPNPNNTTWACAVSNLTANPLTYTLTANVQTTNSVGNYYQVLEGLDDSIGPYYRYETGTSMSAADVSGVLALMQDFFINHSTLTNPSPALLKSLLINGARPTGEHYDYGAHDPVNWEGWGLVNLPDSLPPAIQTNFNGTVASSIYLQDQSPTNALATGDSQTWFVTVTDPLAESSPAGVLRVTLAWTDPPGNPVAAIKLVNDLYLVVTNLDNSTNPVVYFGNDIPSGSVFNEGRAAGSLTNALPVDSINNIENVYLPPGAGTNFSVTVIGSRVNVNAVTAQTNNVVQDYALAITSGSGEVPDAFTVTNGPLVSNPAGDQNITIVVTNNMPLLNQFAGAFSPLLGTNTVSADTNNGFAANATLTIGQTNQWHFYVITNSTNFANAAFVTFSPDTLAIPRMGVLADSDADSTRPQADVDVFVSSDPTLTNLNPFVISNCVSGGQIGASTAGPVFNGASLSRGGTEFVVDTNSQNNQVYYVGVQSEDREGSEYDFLPVFSKQPFSQTGTNGDETVNGVPVPMDIPDGSPQHPGSAFIFALALDQIVVQNLIATNVLMHQNIGDLIGVLSFNGTSVVLNNHDSLPNPPGPYTFVYDDSQNPVPGSQPSDGPGSLNSFTGQQALGAWILTETDDSLTQTGSIQNFSMLIQPHQDPSKGGITVSIQPNSWYYTYVDVPLGYTNLTVFATNLPPTVQPPLQLYLNDGAEPTLTDYLLEADLTNCIPGTGTYPGGQDPGNSISYGPPLQPATYWIGIYNPSTVAATAYLIASLNGQSAMPQQTDQDSDGGTITDDAVTANTISVSATNGIESVNVGMVVKAPRISDYTFTLVSPAGQRILLMENRGGYDTNGAGSEFLYTNVINTTATGGAAANTNSLAVSPLGETVPITYNFYTVPDEMTVYAGTNISPGSLIWDTGFTNNPSIGPGSENTRPETIYVPVPPGYTNITIIMNEFGNPYSAGGDAWIYTAGAPITNFQYLVFTEDTNLTTTPIKFALPPFSFTPVATNYVLSDFEMATNGDYLAPTNIYDAFGGWSMPTNEWIGTNLVLWTNNLVSVVSDPADSLGDNVGSNFLALADGSITRSIPTTPNSLYNVTFWYRGPGISGWWRGEGNATDSSDPENNGNNGSLIGQFDFPAGEVGQAFQFENPGSPYEFAGTNAYVQIRQSASLDVGTGGGFTVEGWINPTNVSYQQPLVEWLAKVPTNSTDTNFNIVAGPFLDRATQHYYYLLGATNWTTSETWATTLGGHLATVDTANEENWIYDTFATYAGTNLGALWIGLNDAAHPGTFVYSSGLTNVTYTNWATGQPNESCNPATEHYVAIVTATNALSGLWVVADNNGVSCTTPATNIAYGVVEVNNIQTNGVQFWISVTNTPGTTNSLVSGNGCLYADLVDVSNVTHEIYSAPGLIQSNIFQHVALTYSTNSGIANLYYDGTNVASTNFGGIRFVPKTGGDVLLGRDMSLDTNNFYDGEMDEMSIYSRALSHAEIQAIYQVSAFSTNRNTGKFDPTVTPAEGLAEAQVVFGGNTNVIYGQNKQWEVNSYTFTATSNTMPLQITGLEPGMLLDQFDVSETPLGNLYYLPEQSLASLDGTPANGDGISGNTGTWTLEIWDNRANALATNADLVNWQLQFVLQTNVLAVPLPVAPQEPATITVPPGQTVYLSVPVPTWANYATNILVSATAPVNLYFNQTTPPTGSNPGDYTFLTGQTSGSFEIDDVTPTTPPLVPNATYYLGINNPGTHAVTAVVEVDFDITTLTNNVPLASVLNTNDSVRYFAFNVSSNAYEATFQLLNLSGNADLVVRKGPPLPTLYSDDYGSFNATNADENIYVLTNSSPVPLSAGRWYLGVLKRDAGKVNYTVLAKELDVTNGMNGYTVINLTNGVPVNFTAGPGTALTNFFRFTVTNTITSTLTNYVGAIHFELYNLSGNGDLTVQTNAPPFAPPFFQSSQEPGTVPELIYIRTNSSLTNLAADWYLGVPDNETVPINFTIEAVIDTNAYFPAFPGATGSGGGAVGAGHAGTIGTVYHVTSTADSGPSTLRAAVCAANRTVVFDVSGVIGLLSPLVITNSYLTIAGQTAPGGGITVAGQMTVVTNAHDVIIRDVRFRRGTIDDSLQFTNVSDVIADHVSAEWSDVDMSVLNSSNVTVQWSVLADSLYTNNPPPTGSLLRYGSGALSFNHNLYADNYNASPRLGDNLSLDFVNNVIYDWGTNAGFSTNDIADDPSGFTNELNYVCNYLIAGTNSLMKNIAFWGGSTNTWIFQTNNFMDSNTNGILDGANTGWNMFTNLFTKFSQPFPLITVPTDEAFLAYEKVLDFAGPDMDKRDSADSSIVEQVRTQTGTLISAASAPPARNSSLPYLDTDQDGIPDFWETTFGTDPFTPNPNAAIDGSGYTELEEYDNWLAGPHALTVTNTAVGVNLQQLFGNTGNLSFSVTNGVNGTVYLTNVWGSVTNTGAYSNSFAIFTPTNNASGGTNFYGYASFDAFVTNNDTVAYFGPVTVSVVVSKVPVAINSNMPPVIITLTNGLLDPTNYGGSDFYKFTVSTNAVAVLFTVTNASGPVDLLANYGLPLPSLSSYEYISTNSWTTSENIVVSSNSSPVALTNGDWYLAVVNVSGSNVTYDIKATELSTVVPPVFSSPTNGNVFSNIETTPFTVTCQATDPNTPTLPLTYVIVTNVPGVNLLNVTDTNLMTINPNTGVISWTPDEAQGPTTNSVAVSVSNGAFSVTNSFIIIVEESNLPPVPPSIPNQIVIAPNTLVVTNTATDPDIPTNPLTYTLTSTMPGTNAPVIDTNGVITWISTTADIGSNYLFTTVVTDTNQWAVNSKSLSATNSFTVTVLPALIGGQPRSNAVPAGGINWYVVSVPTNAIAATNLLRFATNLPVNVWFSTNVPPTITTTNDFDLLPAATNGVSVLTTNSSPTNIVPGGVYFLGVQNTNGVAVNYAIEVNFLLAAPSGANTNAILISSITHTNGGFLLTWFAPTNDYFQVQCTTNLVPANWLTFSNIIAYTSLTPTNGIGFFEFFDNGTQIPFGPTRFYRLLLLQATNTLTLPSQTNYIASVGISLVVTNTAADSDTNLTLTYALTNWPAASTTATINTNGIINWTPGVSNAGDSFKLTTIVTDSGLPPVSATNAFTVFVLPAPAISNVVATATNVTLRWTAPTNDLFQVQSATNLKPVVIWTTFPQVVTPTAGLFMFTDTNPPVPMKFYRLLWLPLP